MNSPEDICAQFADMTQCNSRAGSGNGAPGQGCCWDMEGYCDGYDGSDCGLPPPASAAGGIQNGIQNVAGGIQNAMEGTTTFNNGNNPFANFFTGGRGNSGGNNGGRGEFERGEFEPAEFGGHSGAHHAGEFEHPEYEHPEYEHPEYEAPGGYTPYKRHATAKETPAQRAEREAEFWKSIGFADNQTPNQLNTPSSVGPLEERIGESLEAFPERISEVHRNLVLKKTKEVQTNNFPALIFVAMVACGALIGFASSLLVHRYMSKRKLQDKMVPFAQA